MCKSHLDTLKSPCWVESSSVALTWPWGTSSFLSLSIIGIGCSPIFFISSPCKGFEQNNTEYFYSRRPPDHAVAVLCTSAQCGDLYIHVICVKVSPYLSPELSIDVVGCESCNLPFLGNWTQVTCCHHETNHTIPVGEQSLILAPGSNCVLFHMCCLHVSQSSAVWPVLLLNLTPPPPVPVVMATCVSSCSGPAPLRTAAPSAAGGCWSTGPGPWQWWPSGLSPAPAHTRWNLGWRKYCALPAMRNKEINKKAKAPLMRRSAQLD